MNHDDNVYVIVQKSTPIERRANVLSGVIHHIKKRRRRRKLCVEKTLQRYYDRITQGPLQHSLHELEGAYLSTFQMFSTESDMRDKCINNAFVLMRICRERGIHVKGVTSECKVKGRYISDINNDPYRHNTKVVYVDNYNYFTNHKESKWTITRDDKVYQNSGNQE
jgi:hypothetical protein